MGIRLKIRLPAILKQIDIADFMAILGGVIIGYGIYLIYPPASHIFVGLFLIGWAILIGWSRSKK